MNIYNFMHYANARICKKMSNFMYTQSHNDNNTSKEYCIHSRTTLNLSALHYISTKMGEILFVPRILGLVDVQMKTI